jgi:DNA-binding MarR family transcriptional regulator
MVAAPSKADVRSGHSEPETPVGPTEEQVRLVADSVSHLLRSFERAKQQYLAAAKHDVEWSAHVLISHLVLCGPLRASTLAERVRSDPSTVSRQVAALVKDGLVERMADPDDGRAYLLAATDKGRAAHRSQMRSRNDHFARMLAHWSERDCRRLVELLQRFTADYDEFCASFFGAGGRLPAQPRKES